jgi:hypothetical protein
MAEQVKIIGQNLKDGIGSITVQVPTEGLENYLGKTIAAGQAIPKTSAALIDRKLGQRYGLLADSQTVNIPSDRDAAIQLARNIYTSEPLVANAIDLMVDLCLTGMENRGEDTKAVLYFDNFCKYTDMDALHRQIFQEYLISSDVFLYRSTKIQPRNLKIKGLTKFAYYSYTVLNPVSVKLVGSLMFGDMPVTVTPTQELINAANDPEASKLLKQSMPTDMFNSIKSGNPIPLPPDQVSRISRKRQAYERYADPFLARVFEPVLIKRRMREADLALTETVRSVLVVYKIGSDEFPATDADMKKLAQVLQSPAKSTDLIWNHTLEVEMKYPDAGLFAPAKYDQVNQDIREGLGIPGVLIDGGGGNFATAWTSMLSVMERLDSIRKQVARWQESEYRRINEVDKLNFKDVPSVIFKPLNLRDDKTFKNVLLQLWDRGILSTETILENVPGMDIAVEAKNRAAEKKAGMDELFTSRKAGPATNTLNEGGRPTTDVGPGNYTQRPPADVPKGNPQSETTTQP